MNAMIERVARAIYASRGSTIAFDDKSDWSQSEMRDYARAAIAAMRDPTEAMLDAGRKANELTPGNCLGLKYIAPDSAWRAMIEEALK